MDHGFRTQRHEPVTLKSDFFQQAARLGGGEWPTRDSSQTSGPVRRFAKGPSPGKTAYTEKFDRSPKSVISRINCNAGLGTKKRALRKVTQNTCVAPRLLANLKGQIAVLFTSPISRVLTLLRR